jgi:hypothetical protein
VNGTMARMVLSFGQGSAAEAMRGSAGIAKVAADRVKKRRRLLSVM